MCRFVSMVVTKDRIFWGASQNHNQIIEENKLIEEVSGKLCFVRVEILPPNDDFSKPTKGWDFYVDQDILPDWWNPVEYEKRVRESLKSWLKEFVILSGNHSVENKTVWIYDNSTVKAYGNSNIIKYTRGEVVLTDNAKMIDRS